MQVFTGIRMVQINGHLVVRDLAHLRLDDLSVYSVHRHDSTDIHTLLVKLTVAVEEHLLRQIHEPFLDILAIGVGCFEHKIEGVTLLFACHLRLKRRQHHAFALTPRQRSLLRRFFHQFFFAVLSVDIQLIGRAYYFQIFYHNIGCLSPHGWLAPVLSLKARLFLNRLPPIHT